MNDEEIAKKLRSGELEFVKFKTSYLKSLPASSILSDAGLVFEREEGEYCIFRNLNYKGSEEAKKEKMGEVIKNFGLEEGTCSFCERDGLVEHFLVRTAEGKLEHVWYCEACCSNGEAWTF